ncbi:hypothetical protein CsSME_00035788 [Camellia sinensis var. sinensis]
MTSIWVSGWQPGFIYSEPIRRSADHRAWSETPAVRPGISNVPSWDHIVLRQGDHTVDMRLLPDACS